MRGVQTLDDARRLLDQARTLHCEEVVVVGGGYIGLEMAEAFIRRGAARDARRGRRPADEHARSRHGRAVAVHGGFVDDLLADELVLVVGVAAAVLEDLVVDAGEDVGPAVVVVLRPAVEGVVVALGALEAGAEEDLGDGLAAGDGVRLAR